MNFDKSTQIMRFNKIDNYCQYRFFFNQLVVVVESVTSKWFDSEITSLNSPIARTTSGLVKGLRLLP